MTLLIVDYQAAIAYDPVSWLMTVKACSIDTVLGRHSTSTSTTTHITHSTLAASLIRAVPLPRRLHHSSAWSVCLSVSVSVGPWRRSCTRVLSVLMMFNYDESAAAGGRLSSSVSGRSGLPLRYRYVWSGSEKARVSRLVSV